VTRSGGAVAGESEAAATPPGSSSLRDHPRRTAGHDGADIVQRAGLSGDHGFVGGIRRDDDRRLSGAAIDAVAQACADVTPPS